MAKRKKIVKTYHRWDGDPCRRYQHPNGRLTADLYRGGVGIVPISACELDWAVEINQIDYLVLVEEEYHLRKDDHPAAAKAVGAVGP